LCCGLEALGRGLEIATDGGDRRSAIAPRPGRDNTVSPARHNLLTATFCGTGWVGAESDNTDNTSQFNVLRDIPALICPFSALPQSLS
jgi:hypothetical protein